MALFFHPATSSSSDTWRPRLSLRACSAPMPPSCLVPDPGTPCTRPGPTLPRLRCGARFAPTSAAPACAPIPALFPTLGSAPLVRGQLGELCAIIFQDNSTCSSLTWDFTFRESSDSSKTGESGEKRRTTRSVDHQLGVMLPEGPN